MQFEAIMRTEVMAIEAAVRAMLNWFRAKSARQSGVLSAWWPFKSRLILRAETKKWTSWFPAREAYDAPAEIDALTQWGLGL